MKKKVVLKSPPVKEALFDIRVNLPQEVDLKKLATFQEKIKDQFPIVQKKMEIKGGFRVEKGEVSVEKSSARTCGYLFLSRDKRKIVQARLDGFTFNKLKPYNGWTKFKNEAWSLWQHYIRIASPLNVTRIALRYINEIEVPLPFEDFKEYILTAPEIAKGIPQGLSTFFMRLVIPDPKTQNIAIIIQTIKPSSKEGRTLPLIFDIDVFRNVSLKPGDKKIQEILQSLREYKRLVFFKSVTDKTINLYI